ncbi:replication/maintenance protein RepL, partial [Staphylococcus hominis]|uniref:replication/maintenance protein RepL n=1 Tax=Staphylococcus hominis TaxID=1290 RepID=UPI001643BA16
FHNLYTPQTPPNFLKIYIHLFPQILPLLNNKPQIIHYLFQHLNLSNNTLIKTLTQLPQQTNTTTKTLTQTLNLIQKPNIIKTKTPLIIINPAFLI